MENDQQAKLGSYERAQDFNTRYSTDLATIPDYPELQGQFNFHVAEILQRSTGQQKTTGVTSGLLRSVKRNMAETVIQFASRGVVKAKLADREELANQLDEPVSFITRPKRV
jgi:hypothetical protein